MLDQAVRLLLSRQNSDGGWGVVVGTRSNTEITGLGVLPLQSLGNNTGAASDGGSPRRPLGVFVDRQLASSIAAHQPAHPLLTSGKTAKIDDLKGTRLSQIC